MWQLPVGSDESRSAAISCASGLGLGGVAARLLSEPLFTTSASVDEMCSVVRSLISCGLAELVLTWIPSYLAPAKSGAASGAAPGKKPAPSTASLSDAVLAAAFDAISAAAKTAPYDAVALGTACDATSLVVVGIFAFFCTRFSMYYAWWRVQALCPRLY